MQVPRTNSDTNRTPRLNIGFLLFASGSGIRLLFLNTFTKGLYSNMVRAAFSPLFKRLKGRKIGISILATFSLGTPI